MKGMTATMRAYPKAPLFPFQLPLRRGAMIGLLAFAAALFVFARALQDMAQKAAPHAVDGAEQAREIALDGASWGSAQALLQYYIDQGFDLEAIRAGEAFVPRFYAMTLPQDMGLFASARDRKQAFVKVLLPHVLAENERILETRARLERIRSDLAAGQQLSGSAKIFVLALMDEYELDRPGPDTLDALDAPIAMRDLTRLLQRVDIVPPSLALAQAAEESGWGSSRLARLRNSLFGQMGWRADDKTGLARYDLAHFDDLGHTVLAYMRNLNSHPAYDGFRLERARMRADGRPLDVPKLAQTMERYSELGQDYIDKILTIWRVNDFADYDLARLAPRRGPGRDGRLAFLELNPRDEAARALGLP